MKSLKVVGGGEGGGEINAGARCGSRHWLCDTQAIRQPSFALADMNMTSKKDERIQSLEMLRDAN